MRQSCAARMLRRRSGRSTLRPRRARRGCWRYSRAKIRLISRRCLAAAPYRDCGCRITIFWPSIASIWWGIQWRWGGGASNNLARGGGGRVGGDDEERRAADRALTLYPSTQIPHLVRSLVAGMLGLEENRMRVVAPEVGGGFGSKLNVYAEEALMGFIAMKTGKPVKWIESRRENFLCTIHGRGHVDYFEVAAKND